jgi:hypothetical protein
MVLKYLENNEEEEDVEWMGAFTYTPRRAKVKGSDLAKDIK